MKKTKYFEKILHPQKAAPAPTKTDPKHKAFLKKKNKQPKKQTLKKVHGAQDISKLKNQIKSAVKNEKAVPFSKTPK